MHESERERLDDAFNEGRAEERKRSEVVIGDLKDQVQTLQSILMAIIRSQGGVLKVWQKEIDNIGPRDLFAITRDVENRCIVLMDVPEVSDAEAGEIAKQCQKPHEPMGW